MGFGVVDQFVNANQALARQNGLTVMQVILSALHQIHGLHKDQQ
jgi:hypothetical protein